MKISVAMATFNGEKYIKEQLESILYNLREDDEIIISDDGSKDNTLAVAKSLNDNRIKIVDGPKCGVIRNFENSLKHCTGDIIFLSDQDDVWNRNKVFEVLKAFEQSPRCTCVVHDAKVVDQFMTEIMSSFFEYRKSKPGLINNIYKNSYMGCCMAIKKDILEIALPIPENVTMHDQWLGLVNDKCGKSVFLKKQLLLYRRHSETVTDFGHTSILNMVRTRLYYIKELAKIHVAK